MKKGIATAKYAEYAKKSRLTEHWPRCFPFLRVLRISRLNSSPLPSQSGHTFNQGQISGPNFMYPSLYQQVASNSRFLPGKVCGSLSKLVTVSHGDEEKAKG